jgi:hypothetical protein
MLDSDSFPRVYTLDEVNHKKINIKKPVTYPHAFTSFDLFHDDKFLLFNISKLFVVFCEPTSIKFRDVSAKMNTSIKLQSLFDSVINRIKQHSEYSKLISEKKSLKTIVDNSFKVNNINEDTVVFDIYGRVIQYTRIQQTDSVSIILYIKSFWVNDSSFGFTLRVSQIKRIEPYGIDHDLTKQSSTLTSFRQHYPPPPPPPPPPPVANHCKSNTYDEKPSENKSFFKSIIRPSLSDIISSKQKLKKVV